MKNDHKHHIVLCLKYNHKSQSPEIEKQCRHFGVVENNMFCTLNSYAHLQLSEYLVCSVSATIQLWYHFGMSNQEIEEFEEPTEQMNVFKLNLKRSHILTISQLFSFTNCLKISKWMYTRMGWKEKKLKHT